ncbi:NUDIX domain-containing protein [Streptomyces sp. NPDC014892]|uniref:NUDIX domain-containing protein n=1 Tax=Streptomyces sp. NPDC014892 TaxID=3364930 RepID=UPI0036FE286B
MSDACEQVQVEQVEQVEQVDIDDRVLRVVRRVDAVREGWLHRVAGVVCRDDLGRVLVNRRSPHAPWFAGEYAPLIAGAVRPGESYAHAASRELREELGVHASVRHLFKFICAGAVGPYWFGIHEAVLTGAVVPDAREISWSGWLTLAEYRRSAVHWPLVPDAGQAFERYLTRGE